MVRTKTTLTGRMVNPLFILDIFPCDEFSRFSQHNLRRLRANAVGFGFRCSRTVDECWLHYQATIFLFPRWSHLRSTSGSPLVVHYHIKWKYIFQSQKQIQNVRRFSTTLALEMYAYFLYCAWTFNTQIYSPNYPLSIPGQQTCEYVIGVNEGSQVSTK